MIRRLLNSFRLQRKRPSITMTSALMDPATEDLLLKEAEREGFVPLEDAGLGFRPENDDGGPVSLGDDSESVEDEATSAEVATWVMDEMRGHSRSSTA